MNEILFIIKKICNSELRRFKKVKDMHFIALLNKYFEKRSILHRFIKYFKTVVIKQAAYAHGCLIVSKIFNDVYI